MPFSTQNHAVILLLRRHLPRIVTDSDALFTYIGLAGTQLYEPHPFASLYATNQNWLQG